MLEGSGVSLGVCERGRKGGEGVGSKDERRKRVDEQQRRKEVEREGRKSRYRREGLTETGKGGR